MIEIINNSAVALGETKDVYLATHDRNTGDFSLPYILETDHSDTILNTNLENPSEVGAEKDIKQLLHRDEFINVLLNDISDLILIINNQDQIIHISQSAREIFKISPEEFIGKQICDLISWPDKMKLKERIFQGHRGEIIYEEVIFEFQGKSIWLETRLSNQLDNPDINGIIIMARNLSEQKKIEERLSRQNRRFESFTFTISHVLRQPISNIMGLINIMELKDFCLNNEFINLMKRAALELDKVTREANAILVENEIENDLKG